MFSSSSNSESSSPTRQGELGEMDEKPEAVQDEIFHNATENILRKFKAAQPESIKEPKPEKVQLTSNKYLKILNKPGKASAQKARKCFSSKSITKNSVVKSEFSPGKKEPDSNLMASSEPTDERYSTEDVSKVSSIKRKRILGVKQSLDEPKEFNVGPGPSGIRPQSLKKEGGKKYACRLCSEEFEHGHDFDEHYKTHHFVCEECGDEFATKEDLASHYLSHSDKKMFVCSVCLKKYVKKGHFDNHCRTHTGELPFPCDVCTKRFVKLSDLKLHYRIHTNEKPFLCEICKKGFTQEHSLLRHFRKHTDEKPFACDVCERGFIYESALKLHFRTHTDEKPFACEVCKNVFSRKEYLKRHYRTHTAEKPFVCNVCSRSFSDKSNFNRHERSHTNEK